MSDAPEPRLVEHASGAAFAPTIERLVRAIESAGMTVFAHIDHAAGAQAVGMEMLPTMVLLYGSPRGGTPIMLATGVVICRYLFRVRRWWKGSTAE